jgi:hypothetical protein
MGDQLKIKRDAKIWQMGEQHVYMYVCIYVYMYIYMYKSLMGYKLKIYRWVNMCIVIYSHA